jgi:signal transduction histidine kinase
VQKNAHRLKMLVDDLLDISRIEAGSLQMVLVELEIRPEVEDVLRTMKTTIQDKDITVQLELPPDLPPIWGDRLRFSQVVGNLLSNAVKYSPSGSRVTVSAREHQSYIQLSICDHGIGMSPEDQSRLFTKFFRADNSSTREQSGSGLGLYITKHLVEAHGGGIWATSQLGEGTNLSLVWPRADAVPAGPAPSNQQGSRAVVPG